MTSPEKTVLVTGGSRRIGAAIVRDLADRGFAVAIHHNGSVKEADALAGAIIGAGGRAVTLEADLTDPSAVFPLIGAAADALGPIRMLVNNASIFEDDAANEFNAETWNRHFDIHVKAPAILSAEFTRLLPPADQGLIVNLIDQRVWRLTPRYFSYTLSKSALWTATQTMAQAFAPRIRVNAIAPGPTLRNERQSEADFEAQERAVPLQRGPALEEFGATISWLWETPSVTGQMIALDGGQHLAWQTPDVTGARE